MNSNVIGKIEKSKKYAKGQYKLTFNSFEPEFLGANRDHRLEYIKENLACLCLFFTIND
jgi:hypothetical protein